MTSMALVPNVAASMAIAQPGPTVATRIPPKAAPNPKAPLWAMESKAFADWSSWRSTTCGRSPMKDGQ